MSKYAFLAMLCLASAGANASDSLFLPVKDSSQVGLLKACQDSLIQINTHGSDSLKTMLLNFYNTPFGSDCKKAIMPATKKQKKVHK